MMGVRVFSPLMKKRPTVVDVAEHARVGASTVSRFLRGVPLRPELAARVGEAIEKLGYHPNESARALRGGRSRTIGVVLPKVSNVFFSQSVQVVEEEARKRGCAVILLTHQDRMEQQREHLTTLRRYHVDGVLIVATPGTCADDIRGILPGVPVVAFDNLFAPGFDSVVLQNREAGRMATEHLIGHGYRRIACVTARPEVYSFQERMGGYEATIQRAGLVPKLLTAANYDELSALLKKVFLDKDRPDALLSLSDFATLTILSAMNELGLKAAERIPLVGFDDFGFAPLVDPPLTVIRQPIESMVRHAVGTLFSRIAGEDNAPTQTVMLAGELICRRSCGCGG